MTNEENRSPELDVAEVFRLWRSKRRLVMLCALGGAAIGLAVAFFTPKVYTATVKMVAETEQQGLSPGLSGLTSLVGINLNSLRTDEPLNTALYPAIVSSSPFLVELCRVSVEGVPLPVYVPGIGKPVGFAGTVPANPEQHKLLGSFRRQISIHTDPKTGLTTASVTLRDPAAAAAAVDSLVAKLQRYVIFHRTQKVAENALFISERLHEAKAKYYAAQQQYARFVDANQHTVRESSVVERNRLYNEQQLAYGVYSQLANQFETAGIKVREQTPVLTVIEPAIVPVRHSSPKRGLIVLLCLGLGAVIPLGILFGKVFFEQAFQ